MWLGMLAPVASLTCASEQECQNTLFNHAPTNVAGGSDQLWPLGHNGWISTPMSIDTSVGTCVTMATVEAGNEIVSRDCNDPAVFACTVDCSGIFCSG